MQKNPGFAIGSFKLLRIMALQYDSNKVAMWELDNKIRMGLLS